MSTPNNEAIAAADEFQMKLRQWQGFPLTKYQQKALRESHQSAIDKATEQPRCDFVSHMKFSESRAAPSSAKATQDKIAREYADKMRRDGAIHAFTEQSYVEKQFQSAINKATKRTERSLDFYKRRCDQLQLAQNKMRDPERKMVCDILANGYLDEVISRDTPELAKTPSCKQPQEWTREYVEELLKDFRTTHGLIGAIMDAHNASIAVERQKREQAEQQLRNLTEAHLLQKKIDDDKLLAAQVAIKYFQAIAQDIPKFLAAWARATLEVIGRADKITDAKPDLH